MREIIIGDYMNGEEALAKLMEGNKRYLAGTAEGKNFSLKREELRSGQQPIATVVTCSDSRVVPEYIFDVTLGEIFTVISAGNVVDRIGLGSIEYAVGHLHTPLLVVMGHEKCGAIKAAYHDHRESNITAIVKKITPAIKKVKKGGDESEELEKAVAQNVKNMIRKIRKSPVIKEAVDHGKLRIIGMKYHFGGHLEIIS